MSSTFTSIQPGSAIAMRGIRDAKIRPVISGGTFDVPGITQVSLNPRVVRKPMRGRCGTKRIKVKVLDGRCQILNACLSHEYLDELLGGTQTFGTGPDYIQNEWFCGQDMPVFELEAQVCQIKSGGASYTGDFHLVIKQVVITQFSFSFQDETFAQANLQGEFFMDGSGSLFSLRCNDTMTPIV